VRLGRAAFAEETLVIRAFADWGKTVTGETTWSPLPSMTGFAARSAISVLRERGVAVAPLLKRAGLSEQDFDDRPRRRISSAAQGRFLELAAEATDDSAFGLHLAEETDPRDAGILFYVASGAQDLGEALALFARYVRIVNEVVRLKLLRTIEGLAVEVDMVGLPRHHLRQNTEFGISMIVKALREDTGHRIRPARAAFAHSRNSDLGEFERFYLCPIEFGRTASEGASSDLLEFSNDTLALPLVTADSKLVEALRPFCDAAASQRNTAKGTLRAAVEKEVERLLPNGKANTETVAKALALSARTLSRRLADEGTTFGEVVDQLRRSLALQYLKEFGLSLSQIAWLLGYEGSTSFNHAFKRWTGLSPSLARSKRRLPPPG
jgi:AraC-like DNA-binding protein